MKAEQLIARLINVLPKYTDAFTNQVEIASIVVSGSDALVTTAVPHNLTTGNAVNITGVNTPIAEFTLTQFGGIATCETAQPHDFTLNPRDGSQYHPFANITGANESGYNGKFKLLSVPNRNKFTFPVNPATPSPATGTIFVADGKERGFNGYQAAITVVDPSTFTYPLNNGIPPQAGFGDEMQAQSGFRISGSDTIERVIDAYTKQAPSNSWGFIVLGQGQVSRNRDIDNDADYTWSSGQEYRQRLIQPFNFYVFEPVSEKITGMAARDKMQDLLPAICRALLGYKVEEDFTEEQTYRITLISHGIFSYNEAFYVHRFDFENVLDITYDDTAAGDDIDVAFRDIAGNISESEALELTEPLTFLVNLDDEES